MQPLHEFALAKEAVTLADHQGGAPTVAAGTVKEIDTLGYEEIEFHLHAGTFVDSTGTVDLKVQGSTTTGGTFADVTNAAFVQVTVSNDAAIYILRVRTQPTRRFLKIVATHGGTFTNAIYGVIAYLASPRKVPVTQDKTIVSVT